MSSATGKLRVGTSGWHYKHWIGTFYPPRNSAANMLVFYQERFDTVELNNSFYQLPKKPALEKWRESTPPDFCFAVKGSRFLTHMKKLKDAEAGIVKFLEAVEVLREKLGPILFQLPPNWEIDASRLRSFLGALPPYHRYAFEFRNPTWEAPEIYRLLSEFRAAHCAFDLAGYQSPLHVTADFTYLRLHGPGGKYQGTYSEEALVGWAERIAGWLRQPTSVYIYFDNDDSGYAPADAARLKALVSQQL
ncbi:MAG: DUF72 domain-containing protein [Acidobacteriota bacterium]|nr:DUF72 domain-containing protein [Acidobacteriota bacterium]